MRTINCKREDYTSKARATLAGKKALDDSPDTLTVYKCGNHWHWARLVNLTAIRKER